MTIEELKDDLHEMLRVLREIDTLVELKSLYEMQLEMLDENKKTYSVQFEAYNRKLNKVRKDLVIINKERECLVKEYIEPFNRLPRNYKTIAFMRYIDGAPFKIIERELNMSATSVRVRATELKDILYKIINE